MATKKKNDWIEDICKLDDDTPGLLGDIPRENLDEFTVGQLKALHKDMLEDIENAASVDVLATTDGDADDDTDPDKVAKDFISMCGETYDPKASSECQKQCQQDFPEAYEACKNWYASLETVGKSTKSKKTSLGKTEWNHARGKQGGLIDEFFLEGNCGTMEDICAFSGGKEARCMHHMKHLVADLGIQIQFNWKKVTVGEGDDAKTTQVKQYWWHDKDKRRKGEDLTGKSAYPNKN